MIMMETEIQNIQPNIRRNDFSRRWHVNSYS